MTVVYDDKPEAPDRLEPVVWVTCGDQDSPYQGEAMVDMLRAFDANERSSVRSLRIDDCSRLKDASLLELFPSLEGVDLLGEKLRDISGVKACQGLEEINVEVPSKRCSMEPLAHLPNLRRLSIKAYRDSDADVVNRCVRLDRLCLAKWPDTDLSRLPDLKLVRLWLYQTKIETININDERLETIDCESSRYLERIDASDFDVLFLTQCGRFDPMSVSGTISIAHLYGIPKMDFRFVHQCPQLKLLSVSAKSVEHVEALSHAKHLKMLKLDGNAKISMLGKDLSVKLRDTYVNFYRNGEKVESEELQKQWRKIAPNYTGDHRSEGPVVHMDSKELEANSVVPGAIAKLLARQEAVDQPVCLGNSTLLETRMDDVRWSFGELASPSYDDFIAEVRQYQEEIGTGSPWDPNEVICEGPAIVLYQSFDDASDDGDEYQEFEVTVGSDGAPITSGQMLFELHHKCRERLLEAQYTFFEGLQVLEDGRLELLLGS